MGVSKNRGTPKWMVYNGKPENPIKMDDLGVPLFSETSIYIVYIYIYYIYNIPLKTNMSPKNWWLADVISFFRNGPISGDMLIFGGASIYVDQLSAGFILFGSCAAARTNNLSIYYPRHILLYMIYSCLPTHISICIMFSLDHRYVFARICAPVWTCWNLVTYR